MNKVKIFFAILFLSFSMTVSAGIIHVPGDQPTIQAGINAAFDGDTVMVAGGTHMGNGNRDLDFSGKAITVKSENGPGSCIIDCGGSPSAQHRAFSFSNWETEDSVVEGFTIRNGYRDKGGAILCLSAYPTIQNCLITGNTAEEEGGAIYSNDGGGVFLNNTISGNTANDGGGLYAADAYTLDLRDNLITGNTVPGDGGGIYAYQCEYVIITLNNDIITGNQAAQGGGIYGYSSQFDMEAVTIINNTASSNGGGISSGASTLFWIKDSLIAENTATGSYGGGIFLESGNASISKSHLTGNHALKGGALYGGNHSYFELYKNTIRGNSGSQDGGGCFFHNAEGIITENVINENSTSGNGGAIYCERDISGFWLTVLENTLRTNTAANDGGAIYCFDDSRTCFMKNMITGNMADHGGGISCHGNSTTEFRMNTITGNTAENRGGGFQCHSASPKLIKNNIFSNSAGADGGGISCEAGAYPTLRLNTIRTNMAENRGGGIYCDNAAPAISDNTIAENSASHEGSGNGYGGGICCVNGSASAISSNTVSSNKAFRDGGGFFCESASPSISKNTISGNRAENDGGGVYCDNASPSIAGNMILDNGADGNGAGIYCGNGASPPIDNNTMTGNAAQNSGGAIYADSASPAIISSILWEDAPDEIHMASGTLSVTYSDVEGGYTGTGNMDADPLFVSGPAGDYYLSQIAAGQVTDSPCVDTGDPGGGVMHGSTRTDTLQDTTVNDMGYHACVTIRIPADQPTIQAGIDTSVDGDTVLVSDGSYAGAGNRDLNFNGKAISLRSANGPGVCVIDCQGSTSDPHRGFYFNSGEEEDSVLQGFTIKNGYAPESLDHSYGGGIYCTAASPTITNNIISGNHCDAYYRGMGGGIYCGSEWTIAPYCSPKIVNNIVEYNSAGTRGMGGGIYACSHRPIIANNVILGNSITGSSGGGAGIACSDAVIENNLILQNIGYGGGLYCTGYAIISGNTIQLNSAPAGGGIASSSGRMVLHPRIMNNIITNNEVTGRGAGIYVEDNVEITNNIISGNKIVDPPSSFGGGGIYCNGPSYMPWQNAVLKNNTIYGNTIPTGHVGGGGGISCVPTVRILNAIIWGNEPSNVKGLPVITYSDIQGGYGGEGNIDADPQFISGPMGDFYLGQTAAGQSTDSPCVDAGDPNSEKIQGTTRTDFTQDTGTVNMGYHYPVYLFNPKVVPSAGTENTLFTYSVDVALPDDRTPRGVYLAIDGKFAGVMTLSSGTAGKGTYTYSTCLKGVGYHEAVFSTDFSALPVRLPLIMQLQPVASKPGIQRAD